MREAGARLMGRDRLGRDVFPRGSPEGLRLVRRAAWDAELYDLISVYGAIRARMTPGVHVVSRRPVMSLEQAIERVGRLVGIKLDWAALESFLPESVDPSYRRSCLASSFVAALELARQGKVVMHQEEAFSPLMLRAAR
jgi:segregation and condensation protein A